MTATTTKSAKLASKNDRARAKIQEQVLALLGTPPNPWRADVHLYSSGQARINIWRTIKVKPESLGGVVRALGKPDLVERTIITDSFYLYMSKTAVIKSANPPIEKKYQVSREETQPECAT